MLHCFHAAAGGGGGGGGGVGDWKQRCWMRKVFLAALGVSRFSVVSYWPAEFSLFLAIMHCCSSHGETYYSVKVFN